MMPRTLRVANGRLLMLAGLLAGCTTASPGSVGQDCVDSHCANGGHCLAVPNSLTKYCAVTDGTCASGFRWDPAAGGGLGGVCFGAATGSVDMSTGTSNPLDLGTNPQDLASFTPPLQWSQQNPPPPSTALQSVFGTGAGNLFVVGQDGSLSHSADAGHTWKTQSIAGLLPTGIWGDSTGDLFAVGYPKNIFHSTDGTTWTEQLTAPSVVMEGIWGSSGVDVWAVGGPSGGSAIYHTTNGSVWNRLTSPTIPAAHLYQVWGSGAADIYVVGANGTLIHSLDHGVTWSTKTPAGGQSNIYLVGVWGSSAADVYVVGFDMTANSGFILHSIDQGNTWQKTNQTQPLRAVWGSGADDVYVVGDAGTVMRSSDHGASWLPVYIGSFGTASQFLSGVWGSGPRDVYIAGGLLFHGQ